MAKVILEPIGANRHEALGDEWRLAPEDPVQ